ncbi:MAG TPA: NYN domain-containing protein [Bacillota bacterium]|nr:NYN domain-containing protein [Bacillota bacterium]
MNILVVDGYNVIGDWEELTYLKQKDISLARDRLIEVLMEYQSFTGDQIIIVFDALYVKGGKESKSSLNNIEIIYTKEEETADECIERLVKSLKNVRNQVYVATSDYMEQRTIFSRGALRISARELLIEINGMEADIHDQLKQHGKAQPKLKIPMRHDVLEKFEKWRRGN